jgi:hypothetical protein
MGLRHLRQRVVEPPSVTVIQIVPLQMPAAPRAGRSSIATSPTGAASRRRSAMVLVALGAVDRPVATRERHLSVLAATRAGCAEHLPCAAARRRAVLSAALSLARHAAVRATAGADCRSRDWRNTPALGQLRQMAARNHGRSAQYELALGGGTSGERIAAGGAIVGSGFRRNQRNRLFFWAGQFSALCHTRAVGQPRSPPLKANPRLVAYLALTTRIPKPPSSPTCSHASSSQCGRLVDGRRRSR